MSTTSTRPRLALGLLAATITALFMLPATSQAATTLCTGQIEKGEVEFTLGYSFKCDAAITAYSLTFDQEIGGFEPEVPVLDQTTGNATNELMSCEGDIPSFGLGCFGAYTVPGNEIRSAVDLPRDACTSPRFKAWLWVVSGAKSQMAGPFALRGTVGCSTRVGAVKRLLAWIQLIYKETGTGPLIL